MSLRAERETLVDDPALGGAAFGRALATLVDGELARAAAALRGSAAWALVALGSYARGELCPGSDIDVMLLHAGGGRRSRSPADDAGRLWYPLWDGGFVLGHSVRTVKEALDLADADLDAMTALLDVRLITGDRGLVDELEARIRRLVPRRRGRLVEQLATAARARADRPGPIAEMLAPDLKNGAGGLRDVQSAGWVGWALGPDAGAPTGWAGGVGTLVDRGYLQAGDPARLAAAGARMLEARVALHRVTKGKSDQLALQDQDAVARLVGADDADVLLRGLGESARAVTWITSDLWARLLASEEGPRHRVTGLRDLGDGITLRDGRIAFATDRELDGTRVLVLAARAAEQGAQFERDTLNRIAAVEIVEWTDDARAAFIALLGTGRNAIGVFETLDHVGVLVRLLPEWEHVRARPQRNAYHRFTVDRHSLEAVAECAALLDPADPVGAGSDGDVARRARADVLLLSALLHDIGKGYPGDHSDVGVAIARDVATRIRLDDAGIEELTWLVQHHLLLADTGTRRDLNDEVTIRRFARTVGDAERLDLLYALTLADFARDRSGGLELDKAQLLRELWVKTNAALEDGTVVSAPVAEHRAALRTRIGDDADEYLDAMPASYAAAFSPEELAWHRERLLAGELVMEWRVQSGPSLMCTVVAPDRTGLLATVAGTLALLGFDISAASGYSHRDGMAIEVFSGTDRFERFATDADRARATETLASALDGTLALDEQLAERTRRYRTASASEASDVRVIVDLEASTFATVVEVHAPDDVGLLARVAAVFAALDLDVSQAIVSTVGDRVVDVFYLRDSYGQKFTDPEVLDSLRASVLTHVTSAA